MDRDCRTGRFQIGNQVASGNAGNRNPKWGNKNARKHGLFETVTIMAVNDDGWLSVIQSGSGKVRVHPSAYYEHEESGQQFYAIRTDVIEDLKARGFHLNPERLF